MRWSIMNPVYIPPYGKKECGGPYVEADTIMNIVQEYFGITRDVLRQKTKKQSILYPRQVCIWLLAKYSAQSLGGIGVIFDHADHTSARNAVIAIDNYLTYDDEVKRQIQLLSEKVKAALPASTGD